MHGVASYYAKSDMHACRRGGEYGRVVYTWIASPQYVQGFAKLEFTLWKIIGRLFNCIVNLCTQRLACLVKPTLCFYGASFFNLFDAKLVSESIFVFQWLGLNLIPYTYSDFKMQIMRLALFMVWRFWGARTRGRRIKGSADHAVKSNWGKSVHTTVYIMTTF